MRHLKAADPQRTVIMVQVENEAGTWGSVRDYSPAAQKLFEGPVPPEVVAAMHAPSGANWQEVFGPEAEVNYNRFLVAGFTCRVEFRPTDASGGKHRQFLKVEEGSYANGVFKPIRIWNGDHTDWGLNFTSEPLVLRVSLATY
jgi:hypothetical protein